MACLRPEQMTGDLSVTLFLHGQGRGNQTLTLPRADTSTADFHVSSLRLISGDIDAALVPINIMYAKGACIAFQGNAGGPCFADRHNR